MAVLLGWVLDSKTLADLMPSVFFVNPMVAITFLELSLALMLFFGGNRLRRNIFARGFIVLVFIWAMVFSALIWVRIIFGFDTRVDEWLFSGQVTPVTRAAPGAACGFLLISVMFISLLTGQRKKWEQYAFHVAATVATGVVLDSMVGSAFGYSITKYLDLVPMPLSTTLCFLLLIYILWPRSKGLPLLFKRARGYFARYAYAVVAFSVVMIVVGAFWQQSKADLANSKNIKNIQAFEKQRRALGSTIDYYMNEAYGLESFFEAIEEVSPDEFSTYFNSARVEGREPGLNAVAYVVQVPAAGKQKYQEAIRKKASDVNPWYKNFTVYPVNGKADLAYILSYAEPQAAKESLGYDFGTNSDFVRAMQQARDEGKLIATGVVRNIDLSKSEAKADSSPGFFAMVPIYKGVEYGTPTTVEDRRNRISGFVVASFALEGLFDGVFGAEKDSNLQFDVVDSITGEALYTYNSGLSSVDKTKKYESRLDAAGRGWTLSMYPAKNFGATTQERALPYVILVGGTVLASLSALLVASQIRKRNAALELAAMLTEDLNRERDAAVSSKQRDDAILDGIADGVVAIDINGRITLLNPSTEELSGYTAKEVTGVYYRDFLRFEDPTTGSLKDGFVRQALEGRTIYAKNDKVLVRRDGLHVPIAISAAPIRDHQDKIVGAIIVFRDVAKEVAINRAKEEFVSLASHQLRTPLSSIKWFADMLLEGDVGKLNKGQREYLNEIYSENERMIALINSLLDVSHIDLGEFINEPSLVSVQKIVSSLEKEKAEIILKKKLKITKVFPPSLLDLHVDPRLFRAIMQNLFENAVNYTPAGGTVTISAHQARDFEFRKAGQKTHNGHMSIIVADTGYGIPKTQQHRVFEKLFRADNVRGMGTIGAGLGLYLVKQIVDKLGGKIWFTSVENEGTKFTVVLPIHTIPARAGRGTISNIKSREE